MEVGIRETVKVMRQWKVDPEAFILRALQATEMMGIDLGVSNNHGTSRLRGQEKWLARAADFI